MPFEDLLQPKQPACRTCAFIEALDEQTQSEVDVAMAKAKYGDATLARGLELVRKDGMPKAPGEKAVDTHRSKEHRRA